MTTAAGIIGVGKYLPPKIVTNQDIIDMGIETTNDWIVSRTGIEERRIADASMTSSDMALEASKDAIKDANLNVDDIDLIIVATTSPDYPSFPSTACILQKKLNIKKPIGAFDLSAACTGFTYALTTAAQYVQTGFAKNVLIVGVDCLTRYLNWEDRSICILFGDGGGAAVVSGVPTGYGLLASQLHADGGEAEILKINAGGSKHPLTHDALDQKDHYIFMNGKSVFKVATTNITKTVISTLKKINLTPEEIDHYVSHQANIRIINHAKQKLGLADKQVMTHIHKYGNTSAASIPIVLTEAKEEGRFKTDDILALVGFGAGFTWGCNILKWRT